MNLLHNYAYILVLIVASSFVATIHAKNEEKPTFSAASHLDTYRRVLRLEGGSNFRDMGGYKTVDGKTVVRGKLFRSGAMSSITDKDREYLSKFDFKLVADLRSVEERELYPDYWVLESKKIDYISEDYPFLKAVEKFQQEKPPSMEEIYADIGILIEPTVKRYFNALLEGKTPAIVHCSAGQDRTGITSALVLLTLGVPKDVVIEDYLLSTDFRQPMIEKGKVDLEKASKTNAFAKFMLQYQKRNSHPERPNSLITKDGTPYVIFALNKIEREYGSVEIYLDKVLNINNKDVEKLKSLYLN